MAFSNAGGEIREPERFLPEKWSDWHLDKVIGGHGGTVVYEAVRRDEAGVSRSAVKMLRVPDAESKEKYIEEIKTMLSLKGHPNIVSIEDYALAEKDGSDYLFIRMELLTPLDRYVAAEDCGEAETIRAGIDICTALEYCRKKNVLHLDIKPSNIFVTEEGVCKLGDFGISCSADRLSPASALGGSPNFMGPELYLYYLQKGWFWKKEPPVAFEEIGDKYDQYALGLVLYWIRNRRRPPFVPGRLLTVRDRTDAFNRRMRGEPLPPLEGTTDGLAKIIYRAASYLPSDRYPSPEAMRDDLEKLLNSPAADPEPKNPEKKPEKPRKPKRLLIAGLVSALLCLALLGGWLASRGGPPPDASGTCGESLSWRLDGSVLRISGKGGMNDYKSTATTPPWQEYKGVVNKIVVEEGVTRIGEYAFFECPSLIEVELPRSLRRVNQMAFGYCYKLPALSFPEGVEHLEESIVYRCPKLERIDLPGSILTIEGAFAGECENLAVITLGKGCASYVVKDGVLFDAAMRELICHPAGLAETSYIIPDTVRTLGTYAFAENINLEEIVVPDGLVTVGSCAFTGCVNLQSINLPDSIRTLGIYAFYDCERLSGVLLPPDIGAIDQQAFYNCYSLKEITVPSKVTRIGTSVFGNCPVLEKVVLPPSVSDMSSYAFEGSPNVVIYCESGSYAEQYAVHYSIPYVNTDTGVSGWTEWSEERRDAGPDRLEEQARSVYRWWAAQCTSCGTNNPYHGRSSSCHACGTALANNQGLWKSVFEYSETTENTQTIYGRENGRFFGGAPYWLESSKVTQYRYRKIPSGE